MLAYYLTWLWRSVWFMYIAVGSSGFDSVLPSGPDIAQFKQGVKTVAGKMAVLANGVMNTIQVNAHISVLTVYIYYVHSSCINSIWLCVFRIAMDLTERTAFEWNGSCITGRTSLLIGSGLSFLHEHTSEREGARERDQDPGAPNLSPDHCRHSCWQYFNFFLRTHFIFRGTGKSVKFVFRIAVLSVWTNSPVFYAMYWSLISNRYGFEKYSVWN